VSRFVLQLTPLNKSTSNSQILMLGDWSKSNNERDATVVEYHWNNRAKLYRDYKYISSLYEKYLVNVSKALNDIHGVNHSIEFWRVIVGPWLHYFISIVLDRYEMISLAAKNYEIRYTRIPIYNSDEWIPIDYIDFNHKYYSDEWNYYLYSEIVRQNELIKIKKTKFQLLPNQTENKRYSPIKSFLFYLTRLCRWLPRHVTFVEVDIPQEPLHKLLYKLKDFAFSYYLRIRPDYFKPDPELRSIFFKYFNEKDNFESLLNKLIPLNIPISYVEGYRKIEKDSKKIFPKKTKLIITSNAYFSNEHFKVWAANQKLNGVKFWVMVHGGHHGTALFNGPGELTENIADRFYSWGWGDYNLPSPKLSLLRKHDIKQDGNTILFLPYNISKYSNHIDSSPIASSFNDCIKVHGKFFKMLQAHDLRDKVVVRLKSGLDLWDLETEYKKHHVNNFVYSDQEPVLESISKSGLVVVTYDSTVFLEALTLNVPTCLFIRKDYWEMSEESSSFFESFLKCGVLHYEEETLVKHILTVQEDYHKWWNSNSVQSVINSFLSEYGLSSITWQKDWFDEINSALRDGKSYD